MSGQIKVTYRIILAMLSGNQCAIPGCNSRLVAQKTEEDPSAVVADLAHISGENPGSARYNPEMPAEKRNEPDNLVYVCPTHHRQIDRQGSSYTVEDLRSIKANHEAKFSAAIRNSIPAVSFAELGEVTSHLVKSDGIETIDFSLTEIREKLRKNDLSNDAQFLVTLGLAKRHDVQSFIESQNVTINNFGERLRLGFLKEYLRLQDEGLRGDALFEAMLSFSFNGRHTRSEQAAGLAVLVYFFESCDIFEK